MLSIPVCAFPPLSPAMWDDKVFSAGGPRMKILKFSAAELALTTQVYTRNISTIRPIAIQANHKPASFTATFSSPGVTVGMEFIKGTVEDFRGIQEGVQKLEARVSEVEKTAVATRRDVTEMREEMQLLKEDHQREVTDIRVDLGDVRGSVRALKRAARGNVWKRIVLGLAFFVCSAIVGVYLYRIFVGGDTQAKANTGAGRDVP